MISESGKEVKAFLTVIMIVMAIVSAVVWFSHQTVDTGIVDSKWPEVHTWTDEVCDADGNNCVDVPRSSTSYMVQMTDGKIFDMFWGTHDWDRLMHGMRIKYSARGYDVKILGWRIANPSIFSYEVLPDPR